MLKTYKIREKVSDDLTTQLLHNRGITDEKEAEKFLNPDYELHTHDPYLLKDMEKAVKRILKAIKNNEKIAIYSDYDADGIPGAVVLHDFFKKINYNNFINYIPTRNGEGFGLNLDAVEYLRGENVKLIITIDCGVTDVEEVNLANTRGIDVIVTDHHLFGEKLPQALAIINPKQTGCSYPNKNLCGAGVVFKLVQALCPCFNSDLKIKNSKLKIAAISPGWEKWLLDMVGLATLSDMVPLTGENRIFAHYGLLVLRKSPRPGLSKLFSSLKIDKRKATEDDIAFMITPRINAASRMGIPLDAFKLLSTSDEVEAGILAEHLNKKNDERKGVVGSMIKEIKKRIEEKNGEVRNVIVMGNPDWKPSLVGLVAGSFSDEHGRPVFIWGRSDDGIIKGSCRSGSSVSVATLMEKIKDILIERGGHDGAGGFSLLQENVYSLEERLNEAFLKLRSDIDDLGSFVLADGRLSINEINDDLWQKIYRFAPFGFENPKPIFVLKNVLVSSLKMFGKEKNHLEIILKDDNGKKEISAISFFYEPAKFSAKPEPGQKINLAANLEKYEFGGRSGLRFRIVDLW